jgi:putative hydrolase of the HAD superfamily
MANAMRRFDAVLFDVGETLLRPDPSFGEAVLRVLRDRGVAVDGGGPAWVDRALASVLRAVDDLVASGRQFSTSPERSRAFWTELYGRLLEELGVADPLGAHAASLYEELSKPERYALFPDALPALRALRGEGYRLGIVSNFEAWLGVLLERLGVLPLVDVVVVSGVEGIEKPDPEIFRRALARLGVAPERAVYVGDNPRVDVEPALALGMGAILVDRRGIHHGHPGPRVASLEALGPLLRG